MRTGVYTILLTLPTRARGSAPAPTRRGLKRVNQPHFQHCQQGERCLSNATSQDQTVEAVLVRADSIWDYRAEPPEPLARTTLRVPGGTKRQWTPWPLGLSALAPGTFVRLDLLPNENVQ